MSQHRLIRPSLPASLQFPTPSPYPQSLHHSKIQSVSNFSVEPVSLSALQKHFEGYSPFSKYLPPEKMQEIHRSPNLKLKRYKQSVFYGEIINGKKHGLGIMMYRDGRIYEGNWMGDLKHGEGFERFKNQCVYEGEFVNGRPEGIGRYAWPNGEFYEGEWINGMKHGSGMWKGAKGDSYIGQWKFGKADGYGVHTWLNGDRYEGQFKECLKHGQGIEKFANGDIYKGYYTNGKPSGFGEYYWSNGSYFKGQFLNGLRDGNGMWKRGPGNSDKYEGQYSNDKKSGYGIFTWATGNVYKGSYKSDVRNGYGEMYWSDGSYYKGEWRNGIQHGEGEIFIPGEGFKKGIFQDNVLVSLEKQSETGFARKINTNEAVQTEEIQQVHSRVEGKSRAYSTVHPNFADPEKESTVNGDSLSRNLSKTGSSKLNFRNRGFSSKNGLRDSQFPSRNNPTPKNPSQHGPIISYNHNHPLLQHQGQPPQNLQHYLQPSQKSQTFSRTIPKFQPNPNANKQRILHSSFYMHKMHHGMKNVNGERDRAHTTINGSKFEDGLSRTGPNSEHNQPQSHDFGYQSHNRHHNITDDVKYFSRSKIQKNRIPY